MAEFPARWVVAVVAMTAVGLAGCGGSRSPQVASLGTNSSTHSRVSSSSDSGSTAPTPANGNPTQLLDQWASCMQRHGDSNQADPTVDANKIIDITWNPDIPGGIYGTNKGGQGNSGPGQYCRSYLTDAQNALTGGPPKQPDPATLLRFSRCMQANGIPDFPDPTGDGLSIPVNGPGDLNPANPTFRNASKLCAHKTGVRDFGSGPQPGTIELNGAGPPGFG